MLPYLLLLCMCIGGTLSAHLSPPASLTVPTGHVHGQDEGKFPYDLEREEDYPHQPLDTEIPAQPLIDIFPPKWNPGDVISKTGNSDVDKALDDVMRAGSLMEDRRCAIGIANEGETHTFSNPQWALYSGLIHSAMPYTVGTGQTSLNLFVKKSGLAAGTVGILSYDIDDTDYKIAIMWSIPFDFNIWDIWFNFKVYPKTVVTDMALYRHLYYDAGPWKPLGYQSREEFGVKVRGVMTDHYHSKLIVWVNTDNLDPSGGYDLYNDCAYHPGKVAKFCTQEKFSRGWCWVDKRCSNRSAWCDDGPLPNKLIVWVNTDNLDPHGGYDLYNDCAYHPGKVAKFCTQEKFSRGWCWVDKRCSNRSECIGRHSCM